MDWNTVFSDIQQWMQESNKVLQRYPITSDDYWTWLIRSIGELSTKYDNHPLVIGFLTVLIDFQQKQYEGVA